MADMAHDVVVIGAGIVGLAVARELLRTRPSANIVVLDKEPRIAAHQSAHNSGVIHAGVYYPPGSLKAQLCRAGAAATKKYCTDRSIRWAQPGKLLVAITAAELPRLADLHERCLNSGLEVHQLTAAELHRRQPHITGIAALHIPDTGIVDYRTIAAAFADDITAAGGTIITGRTVDAILETDTGVMVGAQDTSFTARHVVVCGGLQADRLARMAGLNIDLDIVPFRGEYYRLASRHTGAINHLIYPIPDPDLPFLGVHLTPTISGAITIGPNAVLGASREGYAKGSINWGDVGDMVRFPGSWRMLGQRWRTGLPELVRSVSKKAYLAQARRYLPALKAHDLRPYPAGIRAQAVRRDGTLVEDFHFETTNRTLHVLNAPSPAATSAIPIAARIVQQLENLPTA